MKLDYRKADLWGTGAIAYEIFGADNPFYSSNNGKLDSRTYCETELPPLPADVPLAVRAAVLSMLSRDPKKVYIFDIKYNSNLLSEDFIKVQLNVKNYLLLKN